jgi:ribosomal protein S18 acetylase RimI-like enzyme
MVREYPIISASWRDISCINQLAVECFGDDAHPIVELFIILALPGFVRFKAMDGDQIVGFILGEKYADLNAGWVTALGVKRDYRRLGIAKHLMAACEHHLKHRCVRLCVRRSNNPAISLYQQLGYKQKNVWRKYYSDAEDALVMEKVVEPSA